MGLAREREMGTLEQVLVTPIRPSVLLVGKMLPFVVVGCFDFLFAMTTAPGSSRSRCAGAWR
jgi:ABC-2 type transport system permease protein